MARKNRNKLLGINYTVLKGDILLKVRKILKDRVVFECEKGHVVELSLEQVEQLV